MLVDDVPGDANNTCPTSAGDVNNSVSNKRQSFSRLTTNLRVNLTVSVTYGNCSMKVITRNQSAKNPSVWIRLEAAVAPQ